jgi:hypothetical protein
MRRRINRKLPGWLLLAGVILFGGGYALLQRTRGEGPNAGLARLLFWWGLALLVTSAALWISLPPQRRPRPVEEEEEPEPDLTGPPEDDDLIPCPYCRQPIYEGSERCPECGKYISVEDAPRAAMPGWVLVGVMLALLVTILWLLMAN